VTLPAGDEDPDDWDDPHAFVDVMFPADDTPTTGRVGWSGECETEDTEVTASFDALTW
jgi:hypothetical protein